MSNISFTADRIVFDLDGTLVDSAPDLCAAMNFVLKELNHSELSLDDVRSMVGHGARALIERGLHANGAEPSQLEIDRLQVRFLAYYSSNIVQHTRPFPGAQQMLSALCQSGYKLGLCTNKPQALTEALMSKLELESHFQIMVGGDALPTRKPDPLHLNYVLETLGGQGPAVMIGDSLTDVKAARASGIPVIIVDFGYSTVPVQDLGADAIIGSLSELNTIIRPYR